MKLKSLIKDYDFEIINYKNTDVSSIEYNSNNCLKNSLFVCIKGYKTDAHQFIDSAIKNGAGTIVIQNEIENYRENIVYLKCKNTRDALSFLCNSFFECPSEKLKLIGVTGTNGKTSFCGIGSFIFDNDNKNTDILGTLGRKKSVPNIDTVRTTPESREINANLCDMIKNNTDYCFMEVSSHGIVLDRINYLNFYIGVFTNLTHDHLDFHKTMENYYQAKKQFFYHVKEYSIINIDDKYGKRLAYELKADNKNVITFGKNENCDYIIKNFDLKLDSTEFDLCKEHITYHFKINVIGEFNVYNAVPAIIIALNEKVSVNAINNALMKHKGTNGRLEKVYKNIFIDYAHTPNAMENVLSILRKIVKGKLICVFGCGGDRDKEKRSVMGNISREYCDNIIITMDNPRSEDNEVIMEEILDGINNRKNVEVIEDRKKAIQRGIDITNKDDCLIVLGKGHEAYQEIGNVKYYFSDKEEILQYINKTSNIYE